jgi:hypothetical protein
MDKVNHSSYVEGGGVRLKKIYLIGQVIRWRSSSLMSMSLRMAFLEYMDMAFEIVNHYRNPVHHKTAIQYPSWYEGSDALIHEHTLWLFFDSEISLFSRLPIRIRDS